MGVVRTLRSEEIVDEWAWRQGRRQGRLLAKSSWAGGALAL